MTGVFTSGKRSAPRFTYPTMPSPRTRAIPMTIAVGRRTARSVMFMCPSDPFPDEMGDVSQRLLPREPGKEQVKLRRACLDVGGMLLVPAGRAAPKCRTGVAQAFLRIVRHGLLLP